MTDHPRQFSLGPSGSAWGQSHLSLDAVVAFVDDELSPGARRRALAHLAGCPECGVGVVEQTQARLALRAGSVPPPPSSLFDNLRSIPNRVELPDIPAGLAVGPDGQLVSFVPEPTKPVRRRGPVDRRIRIGAGAAFTGLALSALVLTGTSAISGSGARAGAPDTRLQLGVRDTAAESLRASAASGRRTPMLEPVIRRAHQRWYR